MHNLNLIVTFSIVLLLFLYWFVAFIILYHLTRFGIGTQPKRFAATFLMGSVIIFAGTIIVLANIDPIFFQNLS